MRTSFRRVVSCALLAVLSAASFARVARGSWDESNNYLRIVEDDEAQTVRLEVATRTMTPKESGPKVLLVGAAHIGDKSYYDALQSLLDSQDLVLFEGVKPGAAVPPDADADDASRIKLTRQRIRLLGVAGAQYRTKHQQAPASLDTLVDESKGPGAQLLRAAMVDGWGHELRYTPAKDAESRSDIVSLGSDGKPGGEGAAADIKLSDMKPISKDEASVEDGIQVKLAKALKLEFQLSAMDYTKSNWRNSDMTAEELTRRLSGGEASEDGDGKQHALLGMLSGQSFGAKMVGILLKMIELSPTASATTKIMVLEMLGMADDLMEAQGSAIMGVDGAQLMKVLIDDRNEVVLEDLKNVVDESPQTKTIAVFYGAGHLAKMQESLEDQGYAVTETVWHPAITVELKEFPGGAAAANSSRTMVRKALEQQLRKK